MPATRPTAYERFQPWRRAFELGFWVLFLTGNNLANIVTVLMDIERAGLGERYLPWEVVVWETSSTLLWALLIPAVVVFSRRYPLDWESWRRHLPLHLLASVLVCLVHVGGMVALRHAAYEAMGARYDFGDWGVELAYEYLKDARSYFLLIVLLEFYRLLLRRWQGEASLLSAPDEGLPVEPVERPERFLVRKLGREFLLAAQDIEWMQGAGNYVNLRVRGHDYPLRSTLAGIESRLDPARFARVHRSYLVNLDQIASIEPTDNGDARLHLRDGSVLPCSRTYRDALRQRVA
ncbi:LytTR family DNA-binding domain-containing protein [Pseudomarimonas salicorniae]